MSNIVIPTVSIMEIVQNKGATVAKNATVQSEGRLERSVVTEYIRSIFAEGELDKKSNVQNLYIANSDKLVAFYSLYAILAERRIFTTNHTNHTNERSKR